MDGHFCIINLSFWKRVVILSFSTEMNQLIQRFILETLPDEYEGLTLQEVQCWPNYDRVWLWWQALAHYQMKNHYKSIDDVPEGIDVNSVMVMDETHDLYERRNGEWVKIQGMTYDECKDIYGK